MITLGIHDGHTATACIVKDGKILSCVSEERLNRIKEWGGFPKSSIKECIKIARLQPEDIDAVAVVGKIKPLKPENFSEPYPSRKLFSLGTKVMPKSFLRSSSWVSPAISILEKNRGRREISDNLKKLGIKEEPAYYEHHLIHAATAHLTCSNGTKENLILTCDGSGDGLSATVNVGRGLDIERLAAVSNYNSLGEFYTRITQYLGMKPLSHEYKVMGLAPYAKETYAENTYNLIKDFFKISDKNPLIFENHSGFWKWGYIKNFQEIFFGHRFDNIAWATQKLIEEVLVKWVKNAIKETDIHNIVLSGGVFMNVKANLKILELPEVERLFILPSCGDESLAIGAALQRYVELSGSPKIDPLGPLYFGSEFSNEQIDETINKKVNDKFKVERIDNIDEHVGEEVAKGKVVARFSGRMEWGARALGNRSILADGSNRDVGMKINEAIKRRDFWMPFAPTILSERANEYIINQKKMEAPYMIIAFETKDKAREDLIAALHPYDFTARPQILEKDWNPGYYRVLKTFKSETGRGGLLNTSFNLHGDPIVCSPEDAIYTFENSALDALALGNYYIER
jgi:carbamoyltransferase